MSESRVDSIASHLHCLFLIDPCQGHRVKDTEVNHEGYRMSRLCVPYSARVMPEHCRLYPPRDLAYGTNQWMLHCWSRGMSEEKVWWR